MSVLPLRQIARPLPPRPDPVLEAIAELRAEVARLADLLSARPAAERPIPSRRVTSAVASAAGLQEEELLSRRRGPPIDHARQVAMVLVREYCPTLSLDQVAAIFHRDRSTVTHAGRAVRERLARGHRLTVHVVNAAKARLG